MDTTNQADAIVQMFGKTEAYQQLSISERERLSRLEPVVALARSVWEDDEAAREFLTTCQPQLDDRAPIEIALSGEDLAAVEALLYRLEFSLPV